MLDDYAPVPCGNCHVISAPTVDQSVRANYLKFCQEMYAVHWVVRVTAILGIMERFLWPNARMPETAPRWGIPRWVLGSSTEIHPVHLMSETSTEQVCSPSCSGREICRTTGGFHGSASPFARSPWWEVKYRVWNIPIIFRGTSHEKKIRGANNFQQGNLRIRLEWKDTCGSLPNGIWSALAQKSASVDHFALNRS
jgi:hypothetical protein